MAKFIKTIHLVFLLFIKISPLSIYSQGDLLIHPNRIVFEDINKRRNIQHLNLANTGQDSAIYNVSFINYRMLENGEFEYITDPDSGQFFAS